MSKTVKAATITEMLPQSDHLVNVNFKIKSKMKDRLVKKLGKDNIKQTDFFRTVVGKYLEE